VNNEHSSNSTHGWSVHVDELSSANGLSSVRKQRRCRHVSILTMAVVLSLLGRVLLVLEGK
jgi:hypothetical protein